MTTQTDALAEQPAQQEPVEWMHKIDCDRDDKEDFMAYYKPRKIMAVEMRALSMPYKEIAKRLDVPLSHAQQLVVAGKRVFAQRLQAEAREYEEECNDGHFKAYELQLLLPLIGFLKEVAYD